MNKLYLAIGLAVVLVIAGILLFGGKTAAPEQPIGVTETGIRVEVVYQNNAFTPASVKVKIGDRVVFTNKHIAAIRVASNPHPIHTSYPALDSDTLQPDESYEFLATEAAVIKYHNHFNPGIGGEIIVE